MATAAQTGSAPVDVEQGEPLTAEGSNSHHHSSDVNTVGGGPEGTPSGRESQRVHSVFQVSLCRQQHDAPIYSCK